MSDKASGLDRIHRASGCLVRVSYGGFAFLYLAGITYSVYRDLPSLWGIALAALVNAAVVSTRRFTAMTTAAATTSLATSLYLTVRAELGTETPPEFLAGVLAEMGGLLILITRTAWTVRRPWLIPLTVLLILAVVASPLRWSVIEGIGFAAPLGIFAAFALGIGLYLRAVEARRARALAAARRDERLELARDLHDFVAHHVTGIVVQAQAARFAARSGSAQGAAQSPEQLDRMFGAIEKAGTEALTSMRRMVGLLRDAQNADARDGDARPADGGPPRPAGDLSQLHDLVAGFTHPPAALTLAPDLGTLPPEVAASAHRVVQEALTNVRKHAADAAAVRVTVARADDGAVEVAVRDDGGGRSRRLPSSGFGLTGLAERVGALGGKLHAGPREDGGWEVVARLPLADAKP